MIAKTVLQLQLTMRQAADDDWGGLETRSPSNPTIPQSPFTFEV